MPVVDPYAPCPCGSGQKFKWCCQKVESYADKAERLYEGGQVDASLAALDEGLKKAPDNPWLAVRKAAILERRGQGRRGPPGPRAILETHPAHLAQHPADPALAETEGVTAAAAQFQKALAAVPAEGRGVLGGMAFVLGMLFERAEMAIPARGYLDLSETLAPESDDPMRRQTLRMLEADASESPWTRNPYRPADADDSIPPHDRDRFAEALEWAHIGRWAAAAQVFEAIPASPAAWNAALCRLYLADDATASAELDRFIGLAGETETAVDAAALRHLIADPAEEFLVDQIQLIWPVRDRDRLLRQLEADPKVQRQGRGPIDPEDPESPEVDVYLLLDRPLPAPDSVGSMDDLPRVVGQALVGQEIVALEAIDDGTLDALSDRFTSLAEGAIPPALPRTKRIGRVERLTHRLNDRRCVPPGVDPAHLERLMQADYPRQIREIWAKAPNPSLAGRTPEAAARDGDASVHLRGLLILLEGTATAEATRDDFARFRDDLGIPREPEIDPESVDVEALHIGRLDRVPAERLDDARLISLYRRARRFLVFPALERTARALAGRPHLLDDPAHGIDRVAVYSDLASAAERAGDPARALATIVRRPPGRARRTAGPIRPALGHARDPIEARSAEPEDWVPRLAVALERYRENPESNEVVLSHLLDMGLIRLVPRPEDPDSVIVDSRPLQAVLSRYGPRITTAAGGLGISASQSGIWTPEAEAAKSGGGGIWTPDSAAARPPGEKSSLILPGR